MANTRAAIVGTGFIGMVHLETLRRLGDVEVTALCGTNPGLRARCEALGVPACYADYRALLDAGPPDVLHICTPNASHFEIAKYALERGVNVLCEKPFTRTAAEAGALAALAAEKGLCGAVNFHNRFWPMLRQLRELALAGALGRVISVHGSYLQDWLLRATDTTWRLHSAQGGATRAVSDIGSHWLDLAEFTTGQKIARVCARFSTVYPTRYRPAGSQETFQAAAGPGGEAVAVDTEDLAALLLEFEGGAIGSFTVSQMFAGAKNEMALSVAGTEGSAHWDSAASNSLLVGHRGAPNQLYAKDPALLAPAAAALSAYPGGHVEGFADAFKHCFAAFYRALAGTGEGRGLAGFEDGLHSMRLIEAIFESAQSEKWVDVKGERA